MAVDTRTTDRKTVHSRSNLWQIPAATKIKPIQPISYNAVGLALGTEGSYKSVTSERAGKFYPGTFRANPCILKESAAWKVGGMARSLPFVGIWIYDIDGDFWDLPMFNEPTLYYGNWNSGFGNWDQNHANLAKVKAQGKLKDAEFDATLALVELRETLELLKNPFKALTTEISKVLHSGFKKSRKSIMTLDALSGSWLTYRYGIMPLVMDIQNAIEAYSKKLEQISGFQRKSGGASYDVKSTKAVDYAWYLSGIYPFTWKTMFTFERTYKTIHHIYFQRLLEADWLFKLRILGAHPTQLANVIWEGTTLSFVVDWALAVGDWLKAITPDPSLKYLGQCTSQKITTKISAEVITIKSDFGLDPTVPVVLPLFEATSSILERRVDSSTVVLPPFNPDYLKLERVIDSLALLWGPLSTKLRRAKYAS